ncbi:leucine-rich repeat-containing G-protein coupled receptor 6-like [Zophobas morio]|uniref:leucine-rich repeat-containing G-protein coupled receptor 6-like n=1 Tax=Zophobas morio TaxID=2755281 RepID=UPI0030837C18
MPPAAFKNLCILLLLAHLPEAHSICTEDHVTVCDNVDDLYKTHLTSTTTNLVVKSNPRKSEKMMDCLDLTSFYMETRDVLSATIVQQINGLCWKDKIPFIKHRLRYLNFRDNKLPTLESYTFPTKLRLQKLSLVNNSIERIERRAFSFSSIDEIDLSNNRIEVLEREIFFVGVKNLFLRNNKINYIQEGAFQVSVEILDLSYNKLSHVHDGVVSHLIYLQDLRLSHNNIFEMPNITQMERLEVLDLSYNKIKSVQSGTFEKLASLVTLNLSHNKIQTVEFINALLRRRHNYEEVMEYITTLQINLSFNVIKSVKNETLQDIASEVTLLSLAGNPLACDSWASFESFLIHYKSVILAPCTKKYFGSGIVPYCIAEKYIDRKDTENFLTHVETKENLIKCNLNAMYEH